MGNYLRRVEALEQQAAPKTEWWRDVATVTLIDGDTRPCDYIKYRAEDRGEAQTLIRDEGESWPELEQRARGAWGLAGKYLICEHFIGRNAKTGSWFTDAEYVAVGCKPVGATQTKQS